MNNRNHQFQAIRRDRTSRSIGVNNINMNRVQIGTESSATGSGTVAVGTSSCASGNGAIALGFTANAFADGTTALGSGSDVTALGGTGLGNNADVSGEYGTALGALSRALALDSIALGAQAESDGNYIAVGSTGHPLNFSANTVTDTTHHLMLRVNNSSKLYAVQLIETGIDA
jgi:hypothetical protein